MTTDTTALDLDAIRRLAGHATDGPWTLTERHGAGRRTLVVLATPEDEMTYTDIAEVPLGGEDDLDDWRSDAAFIAASRVAVPLLLAEVDRLRPIADAAQYEYGAQPCIEGDCDHAVEADEDAPEGAPCPLVEIRYASVADVIELTRVRAELELMQQRLHEAQRDYRLRDGDARSQTRALQAALAERDQVRRELAAAEEQIASMRAALDEADAEAVTR